MEDSFKLLEDRIRRAAARLNELQSETESLRGELATAQARAEDAEKRLQAYRERIAAATKQLIAALANHGDSMTLLADEQYINLILTTGSRHAWPAFVEEAPSGPRVPEAQVLSVKRSWIRDYKAGRISMDQLEAKVLRH